MTAVLWSTAELPGVRWDPEPPPDDEDDGPWCRDTPTPFDVRQAEMVDLRGQHAGPLRLWTAHNVPTGSYL